MCARIERILLEEMVEGIQSLLELAALDISGRQIYIGACAFRLLFKSFLVSGFGLLHPPSLSIDHSEKLEVERFPLLVGHGIDSLRRPISLLFLDIELD